MHLFFQGPLFLLVSHCFEAKEKASLLRSPTFSRLLLELDSRILLRRLTEIRRKPHLREKKFAYNNLRHIFVYYNRIRNYWKSYFPFAYFNGEQGPSVGKAIQDSCNMCGFSRIGKSTNLLDLDPKYNSKSWNHFRIDFFPLSKRGQWFLKSEVKKKTFYV